MRRFLAVGLLVLVGSGQASAQTSPGGEEGRIGTVVERYLHGLKFNDTTSLHAAFWPEALLLFVERDGKLGRLSQAAWYQTFAANAGKEERGDLKIVAVDATADAASVKVVETYPGSVYTDYLNLLRVGGEWRIVSKIYTSRRTP